VNDVDNIGHNTYGILSQSIQAVVMLLGCIIAMLVVSWQLALIVIASLPVTAAVVMLIGKRSQIQFKKYRAKYGVLEGQSKKPITATNSSRSLTGREPPKRSSTPLTKK
jgi:ATP-binding cassette subfamily B multidrug efflux pump